MDKLKKIWMLFVIVFVITVISNSAFAQQSNIPTWIKNNAGWWASGQIDDNSFAQGIKFLMNEGLLSTGQIPDEFPPHLKDDAKNWADGKISDDEYLQILEKWIGSYKQTPVTTAKQTAAMQKSESTSTVPEWTRNVFVWYADGKVSEDEMLNSIRYLVQERIIILDDSSGVEKLTCNALYNETVNLIVTHTVLSDIASNMLEIGIMHPELLTDKELAESVWAETGRILKANQERLADIKENGQLVQCSFSAEQSYMISFLEKYLNLVNE